MHIQKHDHEQALAILSSIQKVISRETVFPLRRCVSIYFACHCLRSLEVLVRLDPEIASSVYRKLPRQHAACRVSLPSHTIAEELYMCARLVVDIAR